MIVWQYTWTLLTRIWSWWLFSLLVIIILYKISLVCSLSIKGRTKFLSWSVCIQQSEFHNHSVEILLRFRSKAAVSGKSHFGKSLWTVDCPSKSTAFFEESGASRDVTPRFLSKRYVEYSEHVHTWEKWNHEIVKTLSNDWWIHGEWSQISGL